MGSIRRDVIELHLRVYRGEEALLKPFLFNFDINRAERIQVAGGQASAYIISPDRVTKDGFGFTEELLLIISYYGIAQPRIFQIVEKAQKSPPFSLRVDPITYFLVSKDANIEHWSATYLVSHPQARSPISISFNDLIDRGNDNTFIRSKLASKLHNQDLFDYRLPLDEDLLFFGRRQLVSDFLDSIRKGQNRGLFGLRKTGKTSFLFKINRDAHDLKVAHTLYVDCKRPDIRGLTWSGLVDFIGSEIAKKYNRKYISGKEPVKALIKLLNNLDNSQRTVLIFDEIEYISPLSKLDDHWNKDFTPFWQTMWSIQSEIRTVSFIVAGVNPHLCEHDLIDGTQNPMFGIVHPSYLTGLSCDEVDQMTKAIGRRMGLIFSSEAITYVHSRYGGHPLLTRLAFSYANKSIVLSGLNRPVQIDVARMRSEQMAREDELYFYCRHVISELIEFYNDEYVLLEWLASGNVVDFYDLSNEPGYTRHLKSYGILSIAESG